MSKELKGGREFFDGEPVEIYEGRFSGAFYMNEVDGAGLCNGDLVTFMVTARVDAPKFSHIKKTGDLKRTNAMKVEACVALDSAKARFLYDSIGKTVSGVNDGLIESSAGTTDTTDTPDGQEVLEDSFFDDAADYVLEGQ